MQLTKTIRVLRIALDVVGLCALFSAALSLAASYWFGPDVVKALFLHAFFPAFTGGVICFAVARAIELFGLAYAPPSEDGKEDQTSAAVSRRDTDTAKAGSEADAARGSVVTRMLSPRAFVAKAPDGDASDGGPRAAGGGHV